MVVLTFSRTSPLSDNPPDAIRPPPVYLARKTDKYINILDFCSPRVLIVSFYFYFYLFLPPVLADLTLHGRSSKYAVGINITFSLIYAGNPLLFWCHYHATRIVGNRDHYLLKGMSVHDPRSNFISLFSFCSTQGSSEMVAEWILYPSGLLIFSTKKHWKLSIRFRHSAIIGCATHARKCVGI